MLAFISCNISLCWKNISNIRFSSFFVVDFYEHFEKESNKVASLLKFFVGFTLLNQDGNW
jgi:hypothetical protein